SSPPLAGRKGGSGHTSFPSSPPVAGERWLGRSPELVEGETEWGQRARDESQCGESETPGTNPPPSPHQHLASIHHSPFPIHHFIPALLNCRYAWPIPLCGKAGRDGGPVREGPAPPPCPRKAGPGRFRPRVPLPVLRPGRAGRALGGNRGALAG